MGADSFFEFPSCLGKSAGLLQRREGRHDVVLDGSLRFLRETGTQHQDGPAAAHCANVAGFIEVGYAKDIRARLHQQGGDLAETMAVGVGLDHGENVVAGTNAMTQPRKIIAQRVQVDFSPAPVRKAHARK